MKVEIKEQNVPTYGKASEVLDIGDMGVVTEGHVHTGDVILRHYMGYVNLNHPTSTWSGLGVTCGLTVRKLLAGARVTLIAD
jgi:hypothetical protein